MTVALNYRAPGLLINGRWRQGRHTAVVAYNRFSYDIDRLASRFESFMEEFSNILQRQLK